MVAEGGRGGAPASGDGVSSGPSGAEERAGGSGAIESLGAGGSRGGSGAEEDELAADSSRAAPVTANVGALCALDFKISDGVASVCEEVGGFAAPPYLNVLFDRVPVDRMFRTIEANAVKVSYFTRFWCLRGGSDPSFSEQALMVSRALERDVQSGYAEIQGRIDAEAARSAELAAGRLALRAKVKKLKAKVEGERGRADGLEGQLRALKDEVASLRNDKSVLEAEVATERALSASVSQATWQIGRAHV